MVEDPRQRLLQPRGGAGGDTYLNEFQKLKESTRENQKSEIRKRTMIMMTVVVTRRVYDRVGDLGREVGGEIKVPVTEVGERGVERLGERVGTIGGAARGSGIGEGHAGKLGLIG